MAKSKTSSNKKEEVKKVEDKKTSKKSEVKKTTKKKEKKAKKERVGIIGYFKSVKKEVSKVSWPSKKDMFKYSVATIVFVLFFAAFFYGIEVVVALIKTWGAN